MAANEIAKLGYQVDSNGLLVADRRLKKTMDSSKKTESGIKELDKSFVGLKGAVGIAVAALATFGVSLNIKDTIFSFDKAMAGLRATTRSTTEDMAAFERQARTLGATSMFSATQAAEAQRFLAMAGFNTNEILSSTPQILKLATAAEIGLAQAADLASNALGGLQLPVEQLGRVMDVMAETASSANTDIVQLAGALKRAAPIGTAAGVEIEELAAIIGSLSDAGLQAELAGTGVVGIIRQLSNITPAAAKALDNYGLSVEQLDISSRGLTNVMRTLRDANISAGDAIKIFGSESAAAGIIIANYSDHVADMTDQYKNSAGAADEMAKIMEGSLSAAALGLGSAFSEMALQVGDAGLTGGMKQALLAATGLTHTFTGMLPEFAKANDLSADYVANLTAMGDVTGVLASAVAVGIGMKAIPVMKTYALSTIAAAKAQLFAGTAAVTHTSALGVLTTTAAATTWQMNALGMATKFALGPWGLLLGAIGAAATVFVTSKNQAEEMNRKINDQKTAIDSLVESYGQMTEAGRGRFWQDSTSALQSNLAAQTEINMKMAEARSKLLANPMNADNEVREIAILQRQLNELKSAYEQIHKERQSLFTGPDESAWKSLEGGNTAASSEADTTGAINAQIETLKQMREEAGKTSDELFVFREVQKSLANGDLPETTAQVELLAKAIVQAKNNISDAETAFSGAFTGTSNAISEYEQWIDSVWRSANQAQILEQEMQRVKYAMEMGDLDESTARAYLDMLEDRIDGPKEKSEESNIFGGIAGDLQDGVLAFREFGEEGTKEYRSLTRAAQAFAAVQAFATGNIIAGFSQVASVLGSIGSGDLKDISAEVQATQNLNVWGDKADSIGRSMQITANATDKLVGINTNMLKALQVMQQGITKASGLIVRDGVTPQVDTGSLGVMNNPLQENKYAKLAFGFADKLTFGIIGGIIGGMLGGKSKVVDEGIRIVGGSMSDMMDEVMVQGYQQVKYKKWRFGSTKNKTDFANMDSSVGDQFALVFGSIADSVYEGATMLGLAGSDVEDVINNFTIATKKISLKGLSPERQQKELEAYFSQIFDGLVLGVVDFLPEFQKVGEGYGETLTRIATQVAVLDEVSTRFGINFGDKMADPELYARAADNIATLTGGLEEFVNKTAGFTRFADEATQVQIAQNDLNRALAEIGLTLPSSTAGMWELMQSIDGSTEAGQQQIATLLNLQDSSYAYYQMLERQNEQYKNLSRNLRGVIESTYGLSSAAAQTSLDAAIAAAKMGDFGLALAGNFASAMPSQSDFDTFADFAFEQAVTANKLEELAKLSDGQISVEERQLSQLEQINQSLRDNYAPAQDAHSQKQTAASMERMSKDIEQLTRNMQRMQSQTNEHLDRIANGSIKVRVEE